MSRYAAWLEQARIDDSVAQLRPDYRALLVTAEDLTPGPSDGTSERLLAEAEAHARGALLAVGGKPEDLEHMAAWREAFRAFGAKPQRTRNSAEALLRRVEEGLPRINRLADAYNAVSIRTATPLGGENLAAYVGPLVLTRATGDEDFATLASGAEVVEHPEPGEVVWRDDTGVTCRRWNWRQCHRTRLDEDTTDAVFICDVLATPGLEPSDPDARAELVLHELSDALEAVSPHVRLAHRVLGG